eukprot:scaffold5952_cov81-Phaeocystis_antarctica.AAC.2
MHIDPLACERDMSGIYLVSGIYQRDMSETSREPTLAIGSGGWWRRLDDRPVPFAPAARQGTLHTGICVHWHGWSWHNCHQHWHYDNYAHYALRNLCTDEALAWEDRPVVGHKNGWCVARPRPRPDRTQTQTKVRFRIWPRPDPDPRVILPCRCISATRYTPL